MSNETSVEFSILLYDLRENALQILVFGFDCLHCLVDGFADILAFRQVQQLREPCLGRQVHYALGLIVFLADGTPPGAFALQFLLRNGELEVGIAQEDQPQHRHGVFRRLEL